MGGAFQIRNRRVSTPGDGAGRFLSPHPSITQTTAHCRRWAHDTFDRLHEIEIPVLLAGGRYDNQAPPANQVAMHDQLPNSRLEFFEGGHGFIRQAPAAIERIIAFLRE